jgi:voltage-gated potassium channel
MDSGIRDKLNLLIIARRRADGTMRFNPSAQTHIRANDTLIVVGSEQGLVQLDKILNP